MEVLVFLGARAVRTWKTQPFLGVWVLLVEYDTLDSSGDDFVHGAMLGLTVDAGLRQYWALEEFHTFSTSPVFKGFLPGQSSTVLPSLERISERIVEQNVDFPVGGGLQDFLPGQSSSSSSHVPARGFGALDEPGVWVFRTFPQTKKSAKFGSHSGVGTAPRVEPIHAGSSCGLLGRRRRRLDPY